MDSFFSIFSRSDSLDALSITGEIMSCFSTLWFYVRCWLWRCFVSLVGVAIKFVVAALVLAGVAERYMLTQETPSICCLLVYASHNHSRFPDSAPKRTPANGVRDTPLLRRFSSNLPSDPFQSGRNCNQCHHGHTMERNVSNVLASCGGDGTRLVVCNIVEGKALIFWFHNEEIACCSWVVESRRISLPTGWLTFARD